MPVKDVRLEEIKNNPYQKRHHYNDIPDLARTIAVDGLQQVPKARENGDGVQLKFGHRRAQAFRWLKENWKKEGLPERYQGYMVMPLDIEELSDEQMFRGATVENSQRADLSPIERMEEMKAWVEFGYNSKQIAEMYPGMSDATVRGLLYFDKLTPEAKDALHKGEITQGTARAVLSLQKTAGPVVIADVLKEIKEEDNSEVHHWGGRRLPDEIVKDKLEEQPNVKSLWVDSRGGKPRATHDGWLLDMKTFPNRFLPPTAQEHALIVNPDKSNGAFNASLALFAESVKAEGLPESEVNLKFIEHLENPPACSACPFYTKLDGEHYCGLNVCYSRKERAWKRQKMHDAGKKLGIALYDAESDGDLLIFEDKWHNEKHAALFNKKGEDLRLAFMEDVDRKRSQHGYEGIEDGFVVGVVGETLKKLLKQKAEKHDANKILRTVDDVVGELREEKAEALMQEAALYVKALFDGFKDEAMKALDLAPDYGWGSDDLPEPKESASQKEWADYSRRNIAYKMLKHCEDIPHADDVKNLAAFAGAIVSAARSWGVKVPAAFTKLAAGFDEEIQAVAAETKKAGKK